MGETTERLVGMVSEKRTDVEEGNVVVAVEKLGINGLELEEIVDCWAVLVGTAV